MPAARSRTTTNTAAKKGSPARQTIKQSSQSPTVMGFTRSASSTTVNGVPSSSSTTVSSGGGGGGGLLGPVLIISGVFLIWIVFRGKSGAMWNAISGNSGFNVTLNDLANAVNPYINSSGSSGSQGAGNSSSSPVSGNSPDSGTHMGIDSSGNIITINKDYGSMTPAEKDAANNFAHQIGNVG